MSLARTSAVALFTGSLLWFLLFAGGGDAIAAENAGCPAGSVAWPAHVLSFGPDVDLNGDDVICEHQFGGPSEWRDNTTVNVRLGSCPAHAALELHPGIATDRNGDNYVCYIVIGAAHTKLGKEQYVDNARKKL